MSPSVAELYSGDAQRPWRELGFTIEEDRCRVGTTEIVFRDGPPGIHGWAMRDAEQSTFGPITTTIIESPVPPAGPVHTNSAVALHHLVLMVPEFELGRQALIAAGVTVDSGKPFGPENRKLLRVAPRMGDFELELIGPVKQDHSKNWELWGLVIVVNDIDATKNYLGDLIGEVKPALQPRRRIATVNKSAGIGTAVAFLGREETL